jgi:glycosyltransferase involved in cell wall biosynthesis
LEVVVVVDGPDPATVETLESLHDPRLRIVALAENVGGNEARNTGVREAKGEWIALLDDDDEWMPEKLEKQMELASSTVGKDAVIVTLYFDSHGDYRILQPRRFPVPGQSISEYLFCSVPFWGWRQSFLPTATWLISKRFLLDVPFSRGVRSNQDTDWLLRAIHNPSTQIVAVHEPLVVYHCDDDRPRVSQGRNADYSRDWALTNRDLFVPCALSYFLVTVCLPAAVNARSGNKAYFGLVRDCWRHGQISWKIVWLVFRTVILFPLVKRLGFRSFFRGIACLLRGGSTEMEMQ